MFETLIDNIKGEIDQKVKVNDKCQIKGWSFNENSGVCPVRCKYEGTIKLVDIITRSDICEKFKRNNIILCGWQIEVPNDKYCDMQIKINSEWKTFLSFNTFETQVENLKQLDTPILDSKSVEPKNEIINTSNQLDDFISNAIKDFKEKYPNAALNEPTITTLNIGTNTSLPNTIIIDNFYNEPISIRELAIASINNQSQNFPLTFMSYIQNTLEKYINKKITVNPNSNINIKINTSKDPVEIKTSDYQYCALIFLTPDAPINTGLTLYRSKHTNQMTVSSINESTVFKNGHLDITEFEPVDTISNIFNRLVIFNSKLLHSNTHNFGTNQLNGRLIQEFYFNLD